MVSAINPLLPLDGVPASKVDLRDNLEAAKTEIEALQNSEAHVNVKNFGAVGDDATDDTLAIRSAIASAISNNIAIVYFPRGIYRIMPQVDAAVAPESALEISGFESLWLVGAAPGDVILRFRSRGNLDPTTNWDIQAGGALWRGRGIQITGQTGLNYAKFFGMRNIELDGSITGANENLTTFPADPNTGSGWDSTNQGFIYFDNFEHIHLENVVVHNFRGELYYSGGEADTKIVCIDCKAFSSNGNGWNMSRATDSHYIRCEGYDLGNDIFELACLGGITVQDGLFYDTKACRISQIDNAPAISGDFRKNSIFFHGNTLYNMDQVGLEFFGRNATISENMFIDCGTADGLFGGVGSIRLEKGASGSTFPDERMAIKICNNQIYARDSDVPVAIGVQSQVGTLRGVDINDNIIREFPGGTGQITEAFRFIVDGTLDDFWVRDNLVGDCAVLHTGPITPTVGQTLVPGFAGNIVRNVRTVSGTLAQQTITAVSNDPLLIGEMQLTTPIAESFIVPNPNPALHMTGAEVIIEGLTNASNGPVLIPRKNANFRCPVDRFLYTGTKIKLRFNGAQWEEIYYVDTRSQTETVINSTVSATFDGLGRTVLNFAISSAFTFTDFQGLPEGVAIAIRATNGNATLQDNANIVTGTGADLALSLDKAVVAFVISGQLRLSGG